MQRRSLLSRVFPSTSQLIAIAASSVLLGAACQTPQASTSSDEVQAKEAKPAPAAKTRAELPQSKLVLWLHSGADQLETSGGNVVQWKDASGQGNHLVAAGQSMQPSLAEGTQGKPAAVRFDGEDDMLLSEGFEPAQLPAATVFIVATPATNSGNFDGLISAGNRGAEDSFTGFNVDLGGKNFKDCADTYPEPTSALNTVNVQSAKTTLNCGRDLLETSVPLARQVLLAVRIDNDETSLRLDGEPQQSGGGGADTLTMPQLRLGVRFHRQKFQGFYDGTMSEVIVYGRSLSDEEIRTVEAELGAVYGIAMGN
jgi:hypothetical protein